MTLPRLDPDTNDLELPLTIPKDDRPYLTRWYNRLKKDGETPNEFAVRQLNEKAKEDYVAYLVKQQQDLFTVDLQTMAQEGQTFIKE